jgi:hypothetical protein
MVVVQAQPYRRIPVHDRKNDKPERLTLVAIDIAKHYHGSDRTAAPGQTPPPAISKPT